MIKSVSDNALVRLIEEAWRALTCCRIPAAAGAALYSEQLSVTSVYFIRHQKVSQQLMQKIINYITHPNLAKYHF